MLLSSMWFWAWCCFSHLWNGNRPHRVAFNTFKIGPDTRPGCFLLSFLLLLVYFQLLLQLSPCAWWYVCICCILVLTGTFTVCASLPFAFVLLRWLTFFWSYFLYLQLLLAHASGYCFHSVCLSASFCSGLLSGFVCISHSMSWERIWWAHLVIIL